MSRVECSSSHPLAALAIEPRPRVVADARRLTAPYAQRGCLQLGCAEQLLCRRLIEPDDGRNEGLA